MSTLIVIDLPVPPSVNRIWRVNKAGKRDALRWNQLTQTIQRRGSNVIKSELYKKWLRQADLHAMSTGALKGVPMIKGKFSALLVIATDDMEADPPFDVDNRSKGVLDWAQSRKLIFNDRLCMEITVRWGARWEAPTGARLRLMAWKTPDNAPPLATEGSPARAAHEAPEAD